VILPRPCVDFLLLLLFFAEPGGGNALGLGEEAHPVFPQRMRVAEKGLLVPRKREDAYRNRNPHIDAHHSAVRPPREFPAVIAALRENHRAIGERVGVHQIETFLEVLDPLDAQHRPEDLLVSDGHARLDVIEDSRPT